MRNRDIVTTSRIEDASGQQYAEQIEKLAEKDKPRNDENEMCDTVGEEKLERQI